MAVGIIVVMAVGVVLMLTRKLPTAFALILMAVAIALIAGAPLMGSNNSVTTTVLETGSTLLATTMIAILMGAWLGKLMDETGVASTLVRKTVEFAGDRPYVVALGLFIVATLCGSVTGSAPAAMLAGIIGIPAMIAVGVPPVTAAGTIAFGVAAGIPFELASWQYLSTALKLPISSIRHFQLYMFPIIVVCAVAYILVESRRRGVQHSWAVKLAPQNEAPTAGQRRKRRADAPWYSLISPIVPIVLALGFDVPIVPSLLAGVVYVLLTTTRPAEMTQRALRCLYEGFRVAAPALVLFIGIGILLTAVELPGAITALKPVITAISPHNPILFVVVFAVLTPLCLYRGPFNIYGLGVGIASVLMAAGIYPAMGVLGLMSSYNEVLGTSDPTSTQTVWSAEYAGVRPERVMARTLPYTWLLATAGLVLTAVLYL
jgi:TRAP-type mannitol/chloroaromatic compound transport system permease large subunit